MDKCREEFEKQRYWIGLFRTGVDFDVTLGEFGRYISNGTKSTDVMDLESFNEKWEAWANCWQHQQAKVEELQTQLSLQRQRVKAFEEELTSSRNYGDELQKRVDAATKQAQNALQYVEEDMRGNHEFLQMAMIRTFKDLEQALKGEGL
ncbi:hypothetical protein [Acinetobacter baumannii]|uniref:hypothetical protein n=1 Tax=Acinetobacter baumannii TaxID=470 RepID=UPI0015D36AD3|nr:hypothetical protein [Acinetobacter baumannii]MBI1408447.1 hypothetical protein [Acinetobacter baumannii]MBI1430093.1 hypothetical protein [Acinetobacter baumannii]QLI39244.1 hypothetical protein HLG77_05745 [Acinetobacter baumannii]